MAGQKKLFHSYILYGGTTESRSRTISDLAAALVCSSDSGEPCGECLNCRKARKGIHPDVITVEKEAEKKAISVEQVRFIKGDAYIRPNEAARKVYILKDAGEMQESAQNAMLKLLEEGPTYASFILEMDNAGKILPTIISRCQMLHISGEEELEEETAEKAGKLCSCYLDGNEVRFMEELILTEKWEKQKYQKLLLALREKLIDTLKKEYSGKNAKRIMKAINVLNEVQNAFVVNQSPYYLTGWICGAFFETN